MFRNLLKIAVLAFLVILVLTDRAYAYLDPIMMGKSVDKSGPLALSVAG